MDAHDLTFIRSRTSRDAIVEGLRQNGIWRWSDLHGRQIPARIVTHQRGCGEEAVNLFARLVREHGGIVTVDVPPGWLRDYRPPLWPSGNPRSTEAAGRILVPRV